jgi:multidrug resistance efflux pump
MTKERHVRTPFTRQIRMLRQRVMPVIVWCAALACVVTLAGRGQIHIHATGIAEVREVPIAPLMDGVIQAMSVDLFDSVEPGAVVAIIDDKMVRAQIETAETELAQVRAEVSAASDRIGLEVSDRELDELNRQRRFILNEETARLDYLDRVIQQEADKVALERLGIMLVRHETLVKEKLTDEDTYDQIRLQHEALETKLRENESAIALVRQQIDEAVKRKENEQAEDLEINVANMLHPVIESVRVQEARIREIVEHRKLLTLKAPVAGKITQVFHRTGETVLSGEPMLAITASESRRVLAYVDERAARLIDVGTEVEVRSLNNPALVVTTKVVKMGSAIEEFPIRLRSNAMFAQWGLPVLAGNIPADVFFPGEALQLKFTRQ